MSMPWKHMLGVPVIPISAAKNEGVDELIRHAVTYCKISGTAADGRISVIKMDHGWCTYTAVSMR